jgi:hypothetical protein
MGIANMITLGTGKLTNQQIADLALAEFQAARVDRHRGHKEQADERERESFRLARLLT